MNRMLRWVGVCAWTALMLLTAIPALAQDNTGLRVQIESDKTAYAQNEIAKLTITVENTTDHIAADVCIDNLLPNGLVYANQSEQPPFTHAEIAPHASVTHEVYVKLVDTVLPQTGDPSPDVRLLLACALACMLLIGLLCWRSAAAKK